MHGTQIEGRRRRRDLGRRFAAFSALLATALLVGSVASARPTEPQLGDTQSLGKRVGVAPAAQPGELKATGILRWGSTFGTASGYDRYSYILVGRDDARAAARLPGKSLVYMSGTSVQKGWSTGVTYGEALANGWLLKADNGADVMNVQYGAFIGDIGNPAYQKRFIDNVSAFLRSSKADGVFLDDVVANPGILTRGLYPSKYPTAEAWEAAMVSFASSVGRALEANGWYVLVNAIKYVGGDTRSDTAEHTATFWRSLAPSVSGLLSEYWLQNPNDVRQLRSIGSKWYENWDGWQRLASVAQAAGADFFALTYGSRSDTRAMRYLRASFLLDWNGGGGALIYAPNDTADPYHPVWVRQLGLPVKPKFERAPGVWQRRYEKGIAVVNTTGSAVTVRVNGTLWTIGATDALMAAAPRRK